MEWMMTVLVLALAAVGAWWWSQQRTRTAGSGRNDRYAAEVVITPAQTTLMMYLQEVFPGHAVLYAPPLSSLVSVRHAEDRQRATERLQNARVDFVVCATDGKPRFAFQVDAYQTDDSEAARRDAALKHRVLRTAGVRLLRLKRSVRQMPPAAEFRERLEAVSGDASAATSPDRRPMPVSLEQDLPGTRGEFGASDSMSMTDLMGLPAPQR